MPIRFDAVSNILLIIIAFGALELVCTVSVQVRFGMVSLVTRSSAISGETRNNSNGTVSTESTSKTSHSNKKRYSVDNVVELVSYLHHRALN